MKLAASNIAWTAAEDEAAFALMQGAGIAGLEIAPSRIWATPAEVTLETALAYRQKLAEKGFEIAAFQSLLFGKNDLTLFASNTYLPCLEYLVAIGKLAANLGGRVLIFGSPRNRSIPEGMTEKAAYVKAVDFFAQLGARYAELGIILGIEPNPAAYQCNFIRTVEEAACIVRDVNSPGVRLHLDAGELQMNDEAIETVVSRHIDIVAHVHASEPMLAPLGTAWNGHRQLAAVLKREGYNGWVSLEMKRPGEGLAVVKESLLRLGEIFA